MPYDDPTLRELGRECADAWTTTFDGDFADPIPYNDSIPYKETSK